VENSAHLRSQASSKVKNQHDLRKFSKLVTGNRTMVKIRDANRYDVLSVSFAAVANGEDVDEVPFPLLKPNAPIAHAKAA
jgi:hypothetical protein